MPSNIFATTGTNVSVIFIDKNNRNKVILVDASKLGKKVKDGKNQKTVLSIDDEQKIIDAFKTTEPIEDFSVVVDYEEIKDKNYSLSAGQYFDCPNSPHHRHYHLAFSAPNPHKLIQNFATNKNRA
jgi:type I restriction enzyme M protein